MSDEERRRWNERYRSGEYRPRTAAGPFLESWIPRLPPGRALDLACGAGRNAIRLARAGWQVDAIDVSDAAIEMASAAAAEARVEVSWHVADLDSHALPAAAYDLITVIRYVNRSLWPRLPDALAPDGWLLVEHHLATPLDVAGPASTDFRLAPQELLRMFSPLRIVHYEETIEEQDDDGTGVTMALARLVGCNGDPGF